MTKKFLIGYLLGALNIAPFVVFWYFDRMNAADLGCKLAQTESKYSHPAKKFWDCK